MQVYKVILMMLIEDALYNVHPIHLDIKVLALSPENVYNIVRPAIMHLIQSEHVYKYKLALIFLLLIEH